MLSLPDVCTGCRTSRAVSIHYFLSLSLSLNFHLFSLLLLFLPASSYLCTIPMPLPKLHSWYVSFRPHQIFSVALMRACTQDICSITWDQEEQRTTDPILSFYEMLGPVTYKENSVASNFLVLFLGHWKSKLLYPCGHFWKTKPALTPVFFSALPWPLPEALNSLIRVLSPAARASAPAHTAEAKGKSQQRATSCFIAAPRFLSCDISSIFGPWEHFP